MLRGDLSNVYAPYIFIHLDELLFEEEKRSLDILGFSIPLKSKRIVNQKFMRLLATLNRDNRFNITVFSLNYSESDREWLENELMYAQYTRLEFHSDLQSLRYADYMYLFSTNESIVSQISRKNAFHFSEIGEKLRVKY